MLLFAGCANVATDQAAPPVTEAGPASEVDERSAEPASTTADSSAATDSTVQTTPRVELPPVNAPADLVPEGYDGRFLTYNMVLEDDTGARLCGGVVRTSDPPQCDGPAVEGWSWDAVAHEDRAGTRLGQYALIGFWDGEVFTLSEPGFVPNWWDVTRSDVVVESPPPCPEPPDGWWSDMTDPTRLGSQDYNRAIDVVNTRSDLIGIDIYEPSTPRPADAEVGATDRSDGWVPGVLVIELTEVRDDDEANIREHWGGPLCLAEGAGLTAAEWNELVTEVYERWDEFMPGSTAWSGGFSDGRIEVRLPVATAEGQARLDEAFGAGVVELYGLFWAID